MLELANSTGIFVLSVGIEPTSSPSEGDILSIELRERWLHPSKIWQKNEKWYTGSMTEKKEKSIGTVTHWYGKIGVAVIKLSAGLKRGDAIKVKRGETEFTDTVSSLQIDHQDVAAAKSGDDAAVKLSQAAKDGAKVYKAD